jgi:hypothetical protein
VSLMESNTIEKRLPRRPPVHIEEGAQEKVVATEFPRSGLVHCRGF